MSTPQEDPELTVIRDYVINEAKYTQAKDAYNSARKALLALVPKEIGEHTKSIGEFDLKVKYPEKDVWDAEELDALYGSDKPSHVKLSYSIDKRAIKRLPKDEQDKLARCVEVKPGTPEIDIVKVA